MSIIYNYSTGMNYFDNIKGEHIKSTLVYYKFSHKWGVREYYLNKKNNIIEIPNIVNLAEEEYFQMQVIWDYSFPFEIAYNIINKLNENNYNFSFFENNKKTLYKLKNGFVKGYLYE